MKMQLKAGAMATVARRDSPQREVSDLPLC